MTGGVDNLSDFFQFPIEPDCATKLYFSDKLELEKILAYSNNSYFSEYDCILPGYLLINFNNKIIEKVNCLYDDLKISIWSENEFLTNVLYELGSIFVGGCLTNLSKIIEQRIGILSFGFNKDIFKYVSFKNDTKYLIFKLLAGHKAEDIYVEIYYIVDINYINILFGLFNLYI